MESKIKTREEKQKLSLLKLKKTIDVLKNEMENLEVGTKSDAGVEEARGHLECPICVEMMSPPAGWRVGVGHKQS